MLWYLSYQRVNFFNLVLTIDASVSMIRAALNSPNGNIGSYSSNYTTDLESQLLRYKKEDVSSSYGDESRSKNIFI